VPDGAIIDKSLAKKIAGAVRLLTSNKPGEVDAAVQGFVRLLQGADKDMIFAIAERIENESNGKLSDTEMKEIFDAGVEHGKSLAHKHKRRRNKRIRRCRQPTRWRCTVSSEWTDWTTSITTSLAK
jgi:hypothetical protein